MRVCGTLSDLSGVQGNYPQLFKLDGDAEAMSDATYLGGFAWGVPAAPVTSPSVGSSVETKQGEYGMDCGLRFRIWSGKEYSRVR